MPLLDVTEGYQPMAAGVYPAHIREITPEVKRHGPALKWVFEIDGSDDDQWAWSTAAPTPTNKVGRWIKAAGGSLSPGVPFDTDTILGNRVALKIERRETEDGARNRVADVLPASAVGGGGSAPASQGGPHTDENAGSVIAYFGRIAKAETIDDLNAIGADIAGEPTSVKDAVRQRFIDRKNELADPF